MTQQPELTVVEKAWYAEISRYQWLVLMIASLGWVFDVFEGQVFVASMQEAMPSLLPTDTDQGTISFYNNIALASFLAGGALGGVLFGVVSDRIGRTRTMMLTILVYSLFTCLTAAAQTWWHMAVLRFFVAMGVGGEWAVASAMVAEEIPARARARCSAIFHGTSVLGTYLAVLVGAFVVPWSWRTAFLLGAIPALLTIWIRWSLREPQAWVRAQQTSRRDPRQAAGKLTDLFSRELAGRTILGVLLAAVGLATFWGVHIYGKNLLRNAAERDISAAARLADANVTQAVIRDANKTSLQRWDMLGMLLVTTGGGLGLLAFGPICERVGRRGAFLAYHVGALLASWILFQPLAQANKSTLYLALPIFGFLTLGMHAGYAVYFPELFPTRLRGSGAGFCFNIGRVLAAPILFISGWLQKNQGFTLESSATMLSGLYLFGVALMAFAPETKGCPLPE